MNLIDRTVQWSAERYKFAITQFSSKYRTQPKAPSFIAQELNKNYGFDLSWLNQYSDVELQQMAMRVSWIFSNITRIANEVSSAKLEVYEQGSKQQNINHAFEKIVSSPNQFFGGSSLFKYLIWCLMLSDEGAYWYLAPDSSDPRKLREIWPIPINRLTPIRDERNFISGYWYKSNNSEKPLRIDPRYICRFFVPHPYDLWKSLTPLDASKLAIDVYYGLQSSQRSLFTSGGGIPLAIVALPETLGEPDFATIRGQIQEDWKDEKRIAVVRAGTIDIKSVGVSNKELESVASQHTNRDEIDSTFMGVPWRADIFMGGEGLREANRLIRDTVIYPLHIMIAHQIQVHILNYFYSDQYYVKFEDVRQFDRAMAVQEHSVNWRAKTFDEARFDLGLPAYEHKMFPDMGGLPLHLAINPSFVSSIYIQPDNTIRDPQAKPDGVGNLPDSQSPESMTNMLTESESSNVPLRSINIDRAINEATRQELKRYRTVLRGALRRGESLVDKSFDTSIIPIDIMTEIALELPSVVSDDDLTKAFSKYIEQYG
jgi:phage portal protein BeeE